MSRIDLKGLGGRCLPNDFDDFNFDALPEDDDLDGEQLNDNIDAINDETFGVGVDDDVLDDDLEQYSKQTAGLQLDDETPKWFDEPTCSVSAPHPSELPTPPFGFNAFPATSVSSSHCKNFQDFKMQLGTTDTLWKNVDSTTSSLNWSGPEFSALQHSSSYDFINRTIPGQTNFLAVKNNTSPEECSDKSGGIRSLRALPKNALTLEEIERNHQVPRGEGIINACKPTNPTVLPLPSVFLLTGAVTLAELESRLLMQSASHVTASTAVADRSASVLPSDSRIPTMIPSLPPPPPLQCLPFPMLPPIVMQITRAHLLGQLPELPPGFPPITPQMRAAILSMGPPPMIRMPSRPMLPPFPFVQQPSHPVSGRPALPSYLPCPPQSQMQSHIPQVHYHNMSYSRDRSSKLTGLVSNKTISDFALSPFAGFVSKKERSWLIKIQQLQCQGSGNPYEDDFYYTTWRQQKMALERHRKGLEAEDEECGYVWDATNLHHYQYVPPTFAGSLGKPTLSTVNYPRQLIDLSSDSPDDDDKLSVKTSTSQKKLRALLLQVENVASLIIECGDRHRMLCAPSLSNEIQEELRSGIESRMKTVVETLCLNGRLQAVLLINKGRQMFARTLSLANEQQQLHLLKSFFASLSTVIKKVPSNEMNESLLVSIFETFSHFSKNALTSFIGDSKLNFASDIFMNLFTTNLLISLLICCSRQDCHLDTYFCSTTLSLLVRPCSQELQCSLEQYIVLTSADVKRLDTWSANNITGYHGSTVEKIIQNLKLSCRLQGSSN
uniref:PAT1 domain-containing protein n=1 Tax=Elaeophora elaphi TaxID=1147741 RepID=A0A0R3RG75_9BILA